MTPNRPANNAPPTTGPAPSHPPAPLTPAAPAPDATSASTAHTANSAPTGNSAPTTNSVPTTNPDPTGTPPPLFQLHQVTYRYRQTTALDQITLQIDAGTRLALLGANGCGKSTLLRILDGLYYAESGYTLYEGDELNEHYFQHDELAYAFRKRVGLVFQNPDVQLFCPTVFDELAFGPLHLGWTKEKIREAVEEALVHFHIESLRNRAPHHLSGGEKKRVAIASVLIMDPDVVLLDEPIAALDPRSQEHVLELMRSWAAAGKTVVTATHDLDLLEETASHCVVLDRGKIVCAGLPGEVLSDRPLLRRANLVRT